jgi:hypothetical protein
VARPPEPPVAVELEAVLESATEYYEGHFKYLKEMADSLGSKPDLKYAQAIRLSKLCTWLLRKRLTPSSWGIGVKVFFRDGSWGLLQNEY